MKIFSVIIAILLGFAIGNAESRYYDYLTGFDSISPNTVDGYLQLKSSRKAPIFDATSYNVDCESFYYKIRLRATATKGSSLLADYSRHRHGVVWNYVDSRNYSALELCTPPKTYDDLTNRHSLLAEVYTLVDGVKTVHYTDEITDGIDCDGGFNSVCLIYNGKRLKIEVGNHFFKTLCTIDSVRFGTTTSIGCFAAPKTLVTVKRIEFTSKPKPQPDKTTFSRAQIDSIFAASTDPKEGYWQYLDRTMDESKMRLGGKYTIAIVRNGDGYDMLYIDGAIKLPDRWKPTMLKGRLADTIFIDHYNLMWYDAEKDIIDDEGNADFTDNILSLKLPINKTEVRLFKLPR
ncbi:MAG: hypothetical protein ACI309_09380 [Candidatus Limisoma sp.]